MDRPNPATSCPPKPCADYLVPYQEVVDRCGAGFEALLWTSRQSQHARFKATTDMICTRGKRLLDAGCGTADFLAHLNDSKIHYDHYTGMDALPELLDKGRFISEPRSEFIHADFVADAAAFTRVHPTPDIIVFSGSLNTLRQTQALAVLEHAWPACREALVFNFLCAGPCDPPIKGDCGPAHRFETLTLLRWALARTPMISFRSDYLDGRDGTILMRKR
ncbi:MAG: class I SAM-dependent methyltransferase [Phycisphaerales bacterium]|nr:class I SAM-dependent methyltransferase [Phycisphaerales bacterium]